MENNMDEKLDNTLARAVESNHKLEVAISTALLKRIKAIAVSSEPVDMDEVQALDTLVHAYKGACYYRGL